MPIHIGYDAKGNYIQYGKTGKKYYFKTEKQKQDAYYRCLTQSRAIKASENNYR